DAGEGEGEGSAPVPEGAKAFGDVVDQPPRGGGVAAVRFVGAGAATVREVDLVTGRREGPAEPVIPAAVTLDAVQDHDPPPDPAGGRPDGDMERVAVGGP